MPDLHVSSHAISRYRERVEPVDHDTARARLSSPAIHLAAKFGNCEVILPTGHHAVICDATVVTVRPLVKRGRYKGCRARPLAETAEDVLYSGQAVRADEGASA